MKPSRRSRGQPLGNGAPRGAERDSPGGRQHSERAEQHPPGRPGGGGRRPVGREEKAQEGGSTREGRSNTHRGGPAGEERLAEGAGLRSGQAGRGACPEANHGRAGTQNATTPALQAAETHRQAGKRRGAAAHRAQHHKLGGRGRGQARGHGAQRTRARPFLTSACGRKGARGRWRGGRAGSRAEDLGQAGTKTRRSARRSRRRFGRRS